MSAEQDFVRVAHVVAPFGVEGAVKVHPLTDFTDRFAPGSALWLNGAEHTVEWSRVRPAGVVTKLKGIDSRSVAELHRGCYLEVPSEQLRSLPKDQFYHRQLVGLDVETESGHGLGKIADVLEKPANDVWVAVQDGTEQLIPATKDAVLTVDVEARRVVVADWLLDEEDA